MHSSALGRRRWRSELSIHLSVSLSGDCVMQARQEMCAVLGTQAGLDSPLCSHSSLGVCPWTGIKSRGLGI